jgi:hypothetical protein
MSCPHLQGTRVYQDKSSQSLQTSANTTQKTIIFTDCVSELDAEENIWSKREVSGTLKKNE